jgi:ATP-dependent Zn protease
VLRTLLLSVVVAVVSAATTLFVIAFVFGRDKAPQQQVRFSEFLAEVDQGWVSRVSLHGRTYVFAITHDGRQVTKQTIGPRATRDELQQLRPTDPALPAPKVSVE